MKTRKSTFEGDYRHEGNCYTACVVFERLAKDTYTARMFVGTRWAVVHVTGSVKPCPTHATLMLDSWLKKKPVGRNIKFITDLAASRLAGKR